MFVWRAKIALAGVVAWILLDSSDAKPMSSYGVRPQCLQASLLGFSRIHRHKNTRRHIDTHTHGTRLNPSKSKQGAVRPMFFLRMPNIALAGVLLGFCWIQVTSRRPPRRRPEWQHAAKLLQTNIGFASVLLGF